MMPLHDDPLSPDDADGCDPSADWVMAVAGRSGQPPLRFRGRIFASLHRTIADKTTIYIDIWERKRGDFVAAYSDTTTATIKPQAVVLDDIECVVTHLESICAALVAHVAADHLPMMLGDALQTLGQQQQFAILTGDLLAQLAELEAAFV